MTTSSPSPGTPQTATKAQVAAIVAFLFTTVIAAVTEYLDGRDEIELRGVLISIVLGLVTALPTYVATYNATNKRTAA